MGEGMIITGRMGEDVEGGGGIGENVELACGWGVSALEGLENELLLLVDKWGRGPVDKGRGVDDVDNGAVLELVLEISVMLLEVLLESVEDDVELVDDSTKVEVEDGL